MGRGGHRIAKAGGGCKPRARFANPADSGGGAVLGCGRALHPCGGHGGEGARATLELASAISPSIL
eukprot:15473500-Alexandrium_andersonii.AAC.1